MRAVLHLVLLAIMLICVGVGLPTGIDEVSAQGLRPPAWGQPTPGAAADAQSLPIETVRLCGTNSSRSRRCFFGMRECLRNGHGAADCARAVSVCHSCIDGMVACARQPANSCGTCLERYDTCMRSWVALID